jgi:hypothetical protein
MRTRVFSALSGLLLALSATVLGTAAGAAAAPPPGTAAALPATTADAARAFRDGPLYIDPQAAGQLTRAEADALTRKIEDADRPLFLAVLPNSPDYPPQSVLRELRTETGITGAYAVRLGSGFDAGADGAVLSRQAVDNLVAAAATPAGQSAAAQLNEFADLALPQMRGTAPASWGGSGAAGDGSMNTGALITLGALAAAGGAGAYAVVRRSRRRKAEEEREALEKLRVVVDEDITAFGEELDRLDFHPSEPGADDLMRADYERALDSYDRAKSLMGAARHPSDVRPVTGALEDGRFSLTTLAARRAGEVPPDRRAPCFFDPRHGPSVSDADWNPAPAAGGIPRRVPVCRADAARLEDGEEPLARTVETGTGRRPYWEAGPAYGPWAGGYFGGGLLPGLLVGTMLGSMLATPAYAAEYGGGDFGAGDFSGGDYSGADFDPGDFGGGDFGGGGGFDGGGF